MQPPLLESLLLAVSWRDRQRRGVRRLILIKHRRAQIGFPIRWSALTKAHERFGRICKVDHGEVAHVVLQNVLRDEVTLGAALGVVGETTGEIEDKDGAANHGRQRLYA